VGADKKTGLKLSNSWEILNRELKASTHKRNLRKNVKKATKRVGQVAEKEMKNTIMSGDYHKNSSLTIALKHSRQPLVDTGGMKDSVTFRAINDYSVFVGILKSNAAFKNAVTVHGYNSKGATIKVTDAMRRLFSVLEDAYHGRILPNQLQGRAAELWKKHQGPWNALSPSTTQIKLRPRPFVKKPVAKKTLRTEIKRLWAESLNENYRQVAKRVNRGNK